MSDNEQKQFEYYANYLGETLNLTRGELIDFLCDKDNIKSSKDIFKNVLISDEYEKPDFEDLLDYIFNIEIDTCVGNEASEIFDKTATKLAENYAGIELQENDCPELQHEELKNVAESCALSAKSVSTLSNPHVSSKTLVEALSEIIVDFVKSREDLDFTGETPEYLKTALLNPNMPRQALAKAIEILINNDWQLKMLETLDQKLREGGCFNDIVKVKKMTVREKMTKELKTKNKSFVKRIKSGGPDEL